MKTWFKTYFKRPFSEGDLASEADELLRNPPTTSELKDVLTEKRVRGGERSLLDIWRRLFRKSLSLIAAEPTWGTQRRELMELVLDERRWRTVMTVAKDGKHVASWKHWVDELPEFADTTDDDLLSVVTQRYPSFANAKLLHCIMADCADRSAGARGANCGHTRTVCADHRCYP